MSLICGVQINNETCAVNYTPSRENCNPYAFVVHYITDFTLPEYLVFSKQTFELGENYYTPYPKSVHYAIGDGLIYQLVADTDRAWGISELNNPSWPLLNNCAWSDYEDMFIHIAVFGSEPSTKDLELVSRLICCKVVNSSFPNILVADENTVIVPRDLDDRIECPFTLDEKILPKAQVCIVNEGFSTGSNYISTTTFDDLQAKVDKLEKIVCENEKCCCRNEEAIAALEASISQLQTDVQDINVDALVQQIEALEAGNLALQKRLVFIENCLECNNICEPETPVSINYRLDITSPTKLIPGSLQHINFPIKINDTNPEVVTVGPLWYAELLADAQKLCTTFKVTASARATSTEWCAGRVLELYLVVNSENILLNRYTAFNGSQSAYVFGETVVTVPPDTVLYVALKTNEDQYPIEIVQGDIKITCLNGFISPNCVECS